MQFQLILNVEVPEHIAATMPNAPDLQIEFQHVVNAAVCAAIEAWAVSRQSHEQMVDQTVAVLREVDFTDCAPSGDELH